METARRVAGFSRPVPMRVKEAVQRAFALPLDEGVRFERRLFQSTFNLADCREGLRAFIEQREPRFTDRQARTHSPRGAVRCARPRDPAGHIARPLCALESRPFMPVIPTRIDRHAAAFRANREALLALLADVRGREQELLALAERARPRFEERGQLLPRERLGHLLDHGAPFLELMALSGYLEEDGSPSETPGGPIVGIGYVSGVRCVVIASNSAVKGGTTDAAAQNKYQRAQQIALENRLPVLLLVESGGANLLQQARIFVRGGAGFRNQARLSAAGIPQIAVVHGSSTAGGAYLPGLSDTVIVVRGRSRIFLAGPPLLKAATGEIATEEELGGAELHAQVAGTAEFLAEDDPDALAIAREVVARLGWQEGAPPEPLRPFRPPRYDPDELAGVVPTDYRRPYEVREVIARLVDDSDFLDFKARYGAGTVCGQAAIEGYPCGLIGNNGPIDAEGAVKAAQFIQLCCQTGIPLIYLQNTTGYLVGRAAEAGGIVKHGSRMIQAVANATVPQLTLLIGGSFGAGNYGMCGRAYDPRFLFAWPNARLSVMGGEQAARVMRTVGEEKHRRAGTPVDPAALAALEADLLRRYELESGALYCTSRAWDDGIIDPRDSRTVLAFCLSICREAQARRLHPSSFGVARG
jgi:geranyl-CoA carboxylase beta subunit